MTCIFWKLAVSAPCMRSFPSGSPADSPLMCLCRYFSPLSSLLFVHRSLPGSQHFLHFVYTVQSVHTYLGARYSTLCVPLYLESSPLSSIPTWNSALSPLLVHFNLEASSLLTLCTSLPGNSPPLLTLSTSLRGSQPSPHSVYFPTWNPALPKSVYIHAWNSALSSLCVHPYL